MQAASLDYPVAPNDLDDTVKALIKQCADINLKDNEGQTALMLAEHYGHPSIVKMLKKTGQSFANP